MAKRERDILSTVTEEEVQSALCVLHLLVLRLLVFHLLIQPRVKQDFVRL